MKKTLLIVLATILAMSLHSQTTSCGSVMSDTFDADGALPAEWTEYKTSGSVVVANNYLKFTLNNDSACAYRTFDPVSNDCACSFDVQGSRTTMNCHVDLVSSDGKYIASIALGKGSVDLKYSTAMVNDIPGTYIAGVIGDAKFAKETYYSLSFYIDFTSKTVDFYNGDVLTLENIPFLEDAADFGKVDVQLMYMYANTGTVFLDNLSVIEGSQERIELTNTLEALETELSEVTIGTGFQQYPQEAADAYQLVLDAANTVIDDCDALSATIEQTLADLATAQDAFSATILNPIALTLYSGYAFSGDTKEMTCGYYNGDLGAYEDWAVSFTLDSGYMATFAQNVNGSGVSKVYIASEEDLAITLPAELQKSISFIRVGPWRHTTKIGSSGKSGTNDVTLALNTSWFYDWGNADATIGDIEYVKMNWAGGTNAAKMAEFGNTMDVTHHLAFNEPDGEKQANMTVDKAIEQYAILQASGLRLGAPAVTDGAKGRAWLDEFMPKAIAAGYRIDFIPVHYYKIQGADAFLAWLKDFYDMYNVPIWLTEFNYGDIWAANEKTKTEAQVLTNIKAYCEKMDGADFIERYCIFTWQPSDTEAQTVMSQRSPIILNSVGEYYANHEAPLAYTQEVYEQGPEIIASVDEFNSNALKVNVYPNPSNGGVIYINYSDEVLAQSVVLHLYDVAGKEVLVQSTSTQQINVGHLNQGVYMLRVATTSGDVMKKIVIN